MKITYNKKADAAYIYIKKRILPGEVKKTMALNHDIKLDFDKNNKLVGIEILHASRNMPEKEVLERLAA